MVVNVTVDFSIDKGIMKPMHAVNNGPVNSRSLSNAPLFQSAGIPYARTHDSSLWAGYGGSHTVDIPAIFSDFDADPDDPAAYDFVCTDQYLHEINDVGTGIFYRLGTAIEHGVKKSGILPPKDPYKWAVICEHVIRHYNDGWAEGFHYNIEYWEIWNEPDLFNKCWAGTDEQFFKLFETAAKHLKSTFPELKIGGPAITSARNVKYFEKLMTYLSAHNVPLDFFSWHGYRCDPKEYVKDAEIVTKMLGKYGYANVEKILNEWNYFRVEGWESGDTLKYNYKTMKNLKGAAFITGTMCACQNSPIDMLMYYDARPCAWNGMFKSDGTLEPLKGYYPFYMYNWLYRLGGQTFAEADRDSLYICAARNKNEAGILLSYFDDNVAEPVQLKINIKGMSRETEIKAQYIALDSEHDAEIIREEFFTGDAFSAYVKAEPYTSLYIRLT